MQFKTMIRIPNRSTSIRMQTVFEIENRIYKLNYEKNGKNTESTIDSI